MELSKRELEYILACLDVTDEELEHAQIFRVDGEGLRSALRRELDTKQPKPVHTKDSDCEPHIDQFTLICRVCAVDHSGECPACKGHGFHDATCPYIQPQAYNPE